MQPSVAVGVKRTSTGRQSELTRSKMMWWTTPAPGIECAKRGSLNNESPEGVVHMQVSTIGVDLAKNVFQVHGVDNAGKVVITRHLRRKQGIGFLSKIPACLCGMEACGTAHYWAREISKLGHTVRLMPPSYVKGYVKRSKNDAADAAAICEVTRPSMRFVPIKSADQQALLM